MFWHMNVQLANSRKFDAGGRLIFVGPKFSFPPPSENFLGSKLLAVNSIYPTPYSWSREIFHETRNRR